MTIHQILHILRNPYGKTEAEIRRARLAACGYIVEACEVLQTIIDHDGKLTGGDFATIRALLAKLEAEEAGIGYVVTATAGFGSAREFICDCKHSQISDDVDLANARLLAAAPEMLKALRHCLLSGLLNDTGAFDMVRAAIAKAEGK